MIAKIYDTVTLRNEHLWGWKAKQETLKLEEFAVEAVAWCSSSMTYENPSVQGVSFTTVKHSCV